MGDDIKREETTNPDGSKTYSTSFTLTGDNTRPINNEAVEALDRALADVGDDVMHMLDPARMVDFEGGGPAVWSVGLVEVPSGDRPYTLLLTYGFSGIVSPTVLREGIDYEYSIAVPTGQPVQPWAAALLRHLTKYVYRSGRPLEVGQTMPCHAPVTLIPFPPAHHDDLPSTHLNAIVVADDPVIPTIDTPHGTVSVRRFVGITPEETERVEVWSGTGFVDEYRAIDPLLLTDLERDSIFDDVELSRRCEARADAEGSDVPAFVARVAWEVEDGGDLVLSFFDGATARKVANGVRRRVGFGHTCLVMSPEGFEIGFEPSDTPELYNDGPGLYLGGRLDGEPLCSILDALDEWTDRDEPLHIAIPLG